MGTGRPFLGRCEQYDGAASTSHAATGYTASVRSALVELVARAEEP